MPAIRILLLEDSPLDAELVCARLAKAGYVCETDRVQTRDEFVAALDRGGHDIILADDSLPTFDGLSALDIAHARFPDLPFVFVSGGIGEEVAIESLKQGATDFVLKHRLERLVPAVSRALTAASSGRNRGSELTVRLPLRREDAPDDDRPECPPSSVSMPATRLLVVDDNVESARGLAKILTLLGHEVAVVHDGSRALEVARAHTPSIVFLDIGLPGLDGLEVARRFRHDDRLKDVLLVAVSGYGQEQDLQRSSEAGFDHHFVKPVDVDALLALVARHAAQRGASPPTP